MRQSPSRKLLAFRFIVIVVAVAIVIVVVVAVVIAVVTAIRTGIDVISI